MPSTSNQNTPKGLTLRTKMMLLSGAAFAGILFIAVTSLLMMNESRIGGPAYTAIRANQDALESIALLKADLYQISTEVQPFMSSTEKSSINKAAADKTAATVKELAGDIDLRFGIVLEALESPIKRETIKKANAIWEEYKKTLLDEVVPAATKGDVITSSRLMNGIQTERFNAFSKTVTSMVENLRKDVSTTEERVSSSLRTKMMVAVVFCLGVIAVISVFSVVITESVIRPLRACVDFARTVADGRLDSRLEITAGGEAGALAQAMNTMAENLHSMVSRVSSTSEILNSIDVNIEKATRQVVTSARLQQETVGETTRAVEHISHSVRNVSEGVDQLSASTSETSSSILEMAASVEEVALNAEKLGESVDEVSSSIIQMASSIKEIGNSIVNLLDASSTTASSIAEMDATIKQVEKNAMDTSAISEAVRNDAETGRKAVEEAIAGMQEIRRSSHITAEVIENLSLRANDIGTILSVIDEVAEQTNLLALNAAIIAAQAGEHGKGFAVVADEIRELSERTSSSTREIAAVIRGVQEETRRAVDAICQAEQSITEGEKLSERSGAALEKIVSGVQKASVQIREIARATVEQARGSQSIKEAMESVEEMVGHIAASASEHAHSSELIANNVERMKELTSHVRTSTREQSRASGLIARSTEDITAMTAQIREACRTQVQSCGMISKAVSNIQLSSATNAEASSVMENSVTGLSRQIDLLEKEMSGFKI